MAQKEMEYLFSPPFPFEICQPDCNLLCSLFKCGEEHCVTAQRTAVKEMT